MNESFYIYELRNVSKTFRMRPSGFAPGGDLRAVDAVSWRIRRGAVYGLAGGSGSGKTTLAMLLAGLCRPDEGEVLFQGQAVHGLTGSGRRRFCAKVQIIFQNPYLSLDPRWRVRAVLEEGIRDFPKSLRDKRIAEALDKVGMRGRDLDRKPAEFSGGERQRIALARALVMKPEFLILDEPTSQLDVSVQAQVLELLKEIRRRLPGGMLFVSHDLALLSEVADEIGVMHSGELVERGSAGDILDRPQHACTRRLISAVLPWNF